MKLSVTSLVAALATRVAAVEYGAMPWPTQLAVLDNRGADCVQDSCLQALQATDFCTCVRQGDKDCAAYFVTTMKTTETVYSTSYMTDTTSTTESDTLTTTIQGTFTTTRSITVSTSATTTATVGVRPPSRKREPGNKIAKAKREPRRKMPAQYVQSACQDEAAYESACGCVGVFRSTVYAGTVTATETVVSTTYSPTLTESTIVSTESSTQTVSTETVSTTVSTETALATASIIGPFWIRVTSQSAGGGSEPDITGNYADSTSFTWMTATNDMTFATGTDDPTADRAQFIISSDGYLQPIGISRGPDVPLYLSAPANGRDAQINYGTTRERAVGDGDLPLQAEIVNQLEPNMLRLVWPANYVFRSCGGAGAIAPAGTDDTASCVTITLVAVPVLVD